MTYGEEQASYYPDHYGVTGGDILNMNADDSQFLTVKASKMDSRSADVRAFAQLGGSMSGSNVGHMRIKGRVRGDAGRTVHAMVDMGDNWLAMAVFPATDTEWVDVEGPWFDVAALGLNFGYSDGGLAYGGISLHAPNGDVDVSKLEIEFTSF
jgi:hypothetical protein